MDPRGTASLRISGACRHCRFCGARRASRLVGADDVGSALQAASVRPTMALRYE